MNARDVVRRLESYRSGRPLPRGSTMHLQVADDEDLLTLAFLRMGGESLPWAVGIAKPGMEPEVWTVPDARNRERVVQMLAAVTPHLGNHLDSPQWSNSGVSVDDDLSDVPLKQIWVPNGAHVQMLHMLNLRYTFAQAGDPERAAVLRSLGRMSGYLFREAARLGEATILDSSAVLQEAFTFPTDDLRQQHLGFLLALLGTKGGLPARMAAAEEAEQLSVSTSLDPDLERDELEPLVAAYNETKDDKKRKAAKAEEAIDKILRSELERRLSLTFGAISRVRGDRRPINAGAIDLGSDSVKHRLRDFIWLEERISVDGEEGHFPPSPETDRDRRTGAARYHRASSGEEEVDGALIHHDPDLQDDALADGNAIRGRLERVEDRAPEGFKGTVPVWTVSAPSSLPTRLRVGSGVCVAGMPKRSGTIRRVEQSNGTRQFEIEIDNWKRRPNAKRYPQFASVPPAADPSLAGDEILLLPSSMGGLGSRKATRARADQGPGAWLTHGTGDPPPPNRRRIEKGALLNELHALSTSS